MSEDQKIIFTRGVPASGKSTWAQKWVNQDPENRVRVNRDDIRYALYGKYVLTKPKPDHKGRPTNKVVTDVEGEQNVTRVEHELIRKALANGKSVVSDNTHLNTRFLKPYLDIAKQAGVKIENKDFPISVEEAKRRNSQRERKVPDHVIDRMYSNMGPNGEFHLFPGAYTPRPFKAPTERKMAILVDLDGTFDDVRSIRHFVRGKYRDFDAFHRNSLFTPPNPEVVKMVKDAHDAGFSVLVTTARKNEYRDISEVWTNKHSQAPIENMYMRADDDNRPDHEVKKDMFDEISKNYDVVRAIDDNGAAIDAWVSKGIQVTVVPGFKEGEVTETEVIKIDNVFARGVCVRCGRAFKGPGVLGPNCKMKV